MPSEVLRRVDVAEGPGVGVERAPGRLRDGRRRDALEQRHGGSGGRRREELVDRGPARPARIAIGSGDGSDAASVIAARPGSRSSVSTSRRSTAGWSDGMSAPTTSAIPPSTSIGREPGSQPDERPTVQHGVAGDGDRHAEVIRAAPARSASGARTSTMRSATSETAEQHVVEQRPPSIDGGQLVRPEP